jgi:hypothetical protein
MPFRVPGRDSRRGTAFMPGTGAPTGESGKPIAYGPDGTVRVTIEPKGTTVKLLCSLDSD